MKTLATSPQNVKNGIFESSIPIVSLKIADIVQNLLG